MSTRNVVPNRLRVNGREPDNRFDEPDEILFRIVQHGWWPVNKDTIHFLITFPRMSVARSRYCDGPRDVLFIGDPEKKEGVVGWKVRDIPLHVKKEGNEVFLRLVHCPENDFYPHTEVWTIKTLRVVKPWKPGNILKTKIRRSIGRRAMLLVQPSEASEQPS